jgi:hypothetical protein
VFEKKAMGGNESMQNEQLFMISSHMAIPTGISSSSADDASEGEGLYRKEVLTMSVAAL